MKKQYSLFRLAVLVITGIAAVVLTIASCTTTSEKPVRVTAQTIASQQAGSRYLIDVTREGAVYDVAPGVDYGRIELRTSSGDMPLNNFVRRRGFSTGKELLLASSLVDLVDFIPPEAGGFAEASCEGKTCYCTGRKDCSDLSRSGKCKSGPSDAACGDGYGGGKGWGCICAKKS